MEVLIISTTIWIVSMFILFHTLFKNKKRRKKLGEDWEKLIKDERESTKPN